MPELVGQVGSDGMYSSIMLEHL